MGKSRATYKERSQYSCNYNEPVKALAAFNFDATPSTNIYAGLRIGYAGPAQISLLELRSGRTPGYFG